MQRTLLCVGARRLSSRYPSFESAVGTSRRRDLHQTARTLNAEKPTPTVRSEREGLEEDAEPLPEFLKRRLADRDKKLSELEPQSVKEFAELDRKPLPFLSAPLGVLDPPSLPASKTWKERVSRKKLDESERLAQRSALSKEAQRGYYHDLHAMQAHGGKTWIAPTTLIRQDRARYFPAIEGTCLADRERKSTATMLSGKVSLVCFLTSQVSNEHVKSIYDPTYDTYKSDPNFQLIQINSQENTFKHALVSLFLSSIRRTIPKQLHAGYILSHQELLMFREPLALHNKLVGYVYLVDFDQKIRWAAGGFAERHEASALVACTGSLLHRLEERKG